MANVECVVMKVRVDSMLVISEDGQFRSFPLPDVKPRVGERVTLPWTEEQTAPAVEAEPAAAARPAPAARRRPAWSSWASMAAAAAVLLAMVSPVAYGQWDARQPVSLLAVDINPSLELVLDGRQRVRGVTALNEDAETLLQGLDLQGETAEEALGEVIDRAVDLNFIKEGQPAAVLTSVVALRDGAKVPAVAALQERVKSQLTARERDGYVVASKAQSDVLKAAHEAGLSVNQYLALRKVQASGAEIDAAAVKGLKVRDILRLGGLTPEAGFPGGLESDKKPDKGPDDKGPNDKQGPPDDKGDGKSGKDGKGDKGDKGRAAEKDSSRTVLAGGSASGDASKDDIGAPAQHDGDNGDGAAASGQEGGSELRGGLRRG